MTAPDGRAVVLDASVLIAHWEAADAHHEAAGALLGAVRGPLRISPLTLAEILVGPVRTGLLRTAERALARLEVATVPLGDDAPLRLAELRVATGLRLPDCAVLLAAGSVGGRLATVDDRLAAVARRDGFDVVTVADEPG